MTTGLDKQQYLDNSKTERSGCLGVSQSVRTGRENQYLEELKGLLDEAQQEHERFLRKSDDPDREYTKFLYDGTLHWGLRVSQLKEKLADARFHVNKGK